MNNTRFRQFQGEYDPAFDDYQEEGGLAATEGAAAARTAQKRNTRDGLELGGVCDCNSPIGLTVSWAELAAIAGGTIPSDPRFGPLGDSNWRWSQTLPGGCEPTNACKLRNCEASIAIDASDAMSALRAAAAANLLDQDRKFQQVRQIVKAIQNGQRLPSFTDRTRVSHAPRGPTSF